MIGILLLQVLNPPVQSHTTNAKVSATFTPAQRNFPQRSAPDKFKAVTAVHRDEQLLRHHDTNPHATVRGGYSPSVGHSEGKPVGNEVEI